jgi:hypothetical protein
MQGIFCLTTLDDRQRQWFAAIPEIPALKQKSAPDRTAACEMV